MSGYPKPTGYPESGRDGYIGYYQGCYSQYLSSAKAQELINQNVQAMLGSSIRSGSWWPHAIYTRYYPFSWWSLKRSWVREGAPRVLRAVVIYYESILIF